MHVNLHDNNQTVSVCARELLAYTSMNTGNGLKIYITRISDDES